MGRNADLKLNIRHAMKRMDIKAEEMAAALGLGKKAFEYRMADAEERFSVNDLRVIARKTDTTAAWLISGTPAQR